MNAEIPLSMFDRIHRRSGHIAVPYREKKCVLVWGGYMEQFQEGSTTQSRSEYHTTDEIWEYDCFTEVWERRLTKGDIPPNNSGSCGVVLDYHLYVFGGYEWSPQLELDGNSNRLYRLNLRSWVWELLQPEGRQPAPCDKLVGWTHGEKIYFFGGFGPSPVFEPNFTHVLDPVSFGPGIWRGWNNQLVAYDPDTNVWEWPKTKGPIPTPRAAHSGDLNGDDMYIFGGRFLNMRRDDLHCLNMTNLTWSGNLTRQDDPRPQGRSWHSFTFVAPGRAVLYGGLSQFNNVLSDCWTLELPALRWNQCKHFRCVPRLWHSAQCIVLGEAVLVGGLKDNVLSPTTPKDHAEELVVLQFTPKSLLRLCLDTILSKKGRPLRSEWCWLPHHLQVILKQREEQWK